MSEYVIRSKTIEYEGLKIVVKHILDEYPDTSWLGKYTDKRPDSYFIDRRRGILYGGPVNEPEYPEDVDPDTPDDSPLWDEFNEAYRKAHLAWAEWDEHYGLEILSEDVYTRYSGRNEYRYWEPEYNHFTDGEISWEHVPEEVKADIIKRYGSLEKHDIYFTLQDFKRMETLGEDWNYIGIVATVYLKGNEIAESYGLWGIESDSEEKYFEEIEWEQINDALSQIDTDKEVEKLQNRTLDMYELAGILESKTLKSTIADLLNEVEYADR